MKKLSNHNNPNLPRLERPIHDLSMLGLTRLKLSTIKLSITMCFGLIIAILPTHSNATGRAVFNQNQEQEFIQKYTLKYHLPKDYIAEALKQAVFQQSSYAMQAAIASAPAHSKGKTWIQYRQQFINSAKINLGEDFMCEHQEALAKAEAKYGVPKSIILGIIGVETSYGSFTGHYRVIDSLATLAFNSPRRVEFWQDELAQYILMCYQYKLEVGKLIGSIDGGFGIGQFMPSAYLEFAVTAEADTAESGTAKAGSKRAPNLMQADDAIMSIANYLKQHGWQSGQPVVITVKRSKDTCNSLDCNRKELSYTIGTWQKHGVVIQNPPKQNMSNVLADLVTLDNNYKQPAWLALNNFYSIFSYNHSQKYAMVVYQLGNAVVKSVKHDGC